MQDESIASFLGSYRWISLFRKEGSFFVPYDEADQWIEMMMQMPSPPRMELPEELRLEEIEAEPKPLAHVRPARESWNAASLTGEVLFDYLGHVVREDDPATGIAVISERKRIRRNREAETRALQRFEQTGFKRRADFRGRTNWTLTQTRLPAALRDLVAAGWHVEAEGKLFRKRQLGQHAPFLGDRLVRTARVHRIRRIARPAAQTAVRSEAPREHDPAR